MNRAGNPVRTQYARIEETAGKVAILLKDRRWILLTGQIFQNTVNYGETATTSGSSGTLETTRIRQSTLSKQKYIIFLASAGRKTKGIL